MEEDGKNCGMHWALSHLMSISSILSDDSLPLILYNQMWDSKAIRTASQTALAVFPQHLRPAKYDATRVAYLEHMREHGNDQIWARGTSLGNGTSTSGSPGAEVKATRPLFLGGSSGATPRDAALMAAQLPKVKGTTLPLILSR